MGQGVGLEAPLGDKGYSYVRGRLRELFRGRTGLRRGHGSKGANKMFWGSHGSSDDSLGIYARI